MESACSCRFQPAGARDSSQTTGRITAAYIVSLAAVRKLGISHHSSFRTDNLCVSGSIQPDHVQVDVGISSFPSFPPSLYSSFNHQPTYSTSHSRRKHGHSRRAAWYLQSMSSADQRTEKLGHHGGVQRGRDARAACSLGLQNM